MNGLRRHSGRMTASLCMLLFCFLPFFSCLEKNGRSYTVRVLLHEDEAPSLRNGHRTDFLPEGGKPRKYALPLETVRLTSGFGYRRDPITGKRRFHDGIDLKAQTGERACAMLPGIIQRTGRDASRGCYVSICHGIYEMTYCHLSEVLVRTGQPVRAGETVGLTGSTGRSTGPHLHLSLHRGKTPLDPLPFLRAVMKN